MSHLSDFVKCKRHHFSECRLSMSGLECKVYIKSLVLQVSSNTNVM